ncbi:MAG: phosphate propanoyltransferase [Lysinibacillus sp.]
MDEQFIQSIVSQVLQQLPTQQSGYKIPIAVSARHVHVSEAHVHQLFGKNYSLTEKAPLSQSGQFAAQEQVTIVGPKASIHGVRVLGPARSLTQVEISGTDARTLGIDAPLRFSGDIEGSAPITIVGPKGSVTISEGCIIAAAHIHMSPSDAQRFHVHDGQFVNIRALSKRPIIFSHVKVRVNERFTLEMHIDTDEGNAALISTGVFGELLTNLSTAQKVHSSPVQTANFTSIEPVPKSLQVITKRLVTEQDIMQLNGKELVVPQKTIVTALAVDRARAKGIKIVRQ